MLHTCAQVPMHTDIEKTNILISINLNVLGVYYLVIGQCELQSKILIKKYILAYACAEKEVWEGALQALTLVWEMGINDSLVLYLFHLLYNVLSYNLKNEPYLLFLI